MGTDDVDDDCSGDIKDSSGSSVTERRGLSVENERLRRVVGGEEVEAWEDSLDSGNGTEGPKCEILGPLGSGGVLTTRLREAVSVEGTTLDAMEIRASV